MVTHAMEGSGFAGARRKKRLSVYGKNRGQRGQCLMRSEETHCYVLGTGMEHIGFDVA
jgi:hypothetical protein